MQLCLLINKPYLGQSSSERVCVVKKEMAPKGDRREDCQPLQGVCEAFLSFNILCTSKFLLTEMQFYAVQMEALECICIGGIERIDSMSN